MSVDIVTDKPTSGKISITQVVSVAEVTGLSLTVFMSTCLYINSACCVIFRGVCYLQTFILTSFANIFLVSDRVRAQVYIRHNFKQFETLSKFRALSESRLFANVISGVTTSGDS